MKSMTGFAYREVRSGELELVLELKSYNNRFLDIQIGLDPTLSPLEPKIRDFISSRVRRGWVELTLRAAGWKKEVQVRPDETLARAYMEALQKLADATGIDEKPRLSQIVRFEGVLAVEQRGDYESLWEQMSGHLEVLYREYESARTAEGERIASDIRNLVGVVEAELRSIDRRKDEAEQHVREALRERFHQMLGDAIDEDRVHAETALLLVKLDIHEEIMRLDSHLQAFRSAMQSEEGVGKRLDFICQELNREVNTIASKSMQVELQRSAIRIRDALEKIREQLRNVE